MIKLSQKDLKEKNDYAKNYMSNGNAASKSEVDPNANVSTKSVATLDNEMFKDIKVQVNRYALGEKIAELFGEETKAEYYRQLESHEIYSHDESATYCKPYCVAIDLYPFINNGNKMIGGSSKAPTNLQSFCGSYVNLIFLIASQFAGAVADVSFLTYFDYFARKDFGDDYLKTHTKQIERYFKQVIYTLNDPSVGRGNQAVFYNTSIFDENYFKGLFSNVIFPDFTNPKWETVKELQVFFMHWFNKERNRALLTFPVMTFAYQTEAGESKDLEFKNFMAQEMSEGNSFFIYHSDDIDSLSSCCFDKSQEIMFRISENSETIEMNFQDAYEKYTDSIYIYFNNYWKKAKVVKIDRNNKKMFMITTEAEKKIIVTEDHLNPTEFGDVETKFLMLSDKLKTDSGYEEIVLIKEINNYKEDYVYCLEMEDKENPYFTLPNGIITHNCRLRNAIEKDVFAYTLGGTGISTGSKKVFTLNINRMVQDNHNVVEEVKKLHKYLFAYDAILREMQAKGMLPVYDAGFISLDKQYLTIGINGVVEAAEFLGYEISNNKEYKDWLIGLLSSIKDANKQASDELSFYSNYKIAINSEFVPAENLGAKNAQWDKKAGYVVPRDCYNSYLYIVEDDALDFVDKFYLHGKEVTQFLDGGSAYHMNIKEIPTKETWLKIIDIGNKSGCNYWTYNCLTTCCENPECGYIDKNTTHKCAKCGSEDISWATRVIGYLKKIKSFSEARQAEASLRYLHKLN